MKTVLINLSLTQLIYQSLALKYPITVGGFTGDTKIQRFALDSSNNLAIAAISSDMQLVDTPDSNLALYFP